MKKQVFITATYEVPGNQPEFIREREQEIAAALYGIDVQVLNIESWTDEDSILAHPEQLLNQLPSPNGEEV